MSLAARAVLLALIVTASIAGWWRLTAHYEAKGYQRAKAEDQAAAVAQTDRNRELQRAAEKRYVVQAQAREKVITETITEVRYEAAPMAVCPVPEPVRVRLNAAARCALGDSAASCGADDAVPGTR